MKINSLNQNFSARLSRNPSDFGYEKTKQETMSEYDEKIKELRFLKKQAKEFDDFMRSDEVKLLILTSIDSSADSRRFCTAPSFVSCSLSSVIKLSIVSNASSDEISISSADKS